MNLDRKKIISTAKKIVVKVGSSILCNDQGKFSSVCVEKVGKELLTLIKAKKECVLVSSGSVACGMDMLHIKRRPKELPMLQACAAIGQGKLMKIYESFFVKRKHHTAQILLTQDILNNRSRYLNTRNTLNTLLKLGAISIVNENDTVATEEIKFGDNDRLSVLVALIIGADLIINLSNVRGVLDANKEVISDVQSLTELDKLDKHLFDEKTATTVGGMKSKLDAAHTAMSSGVSMLIADGKDYKVLEKILKGEEVGTLFYPSQKKTSFTRSWLIHLSSPKGTIHLDKGAFEAIKNKGKSLLSSGIKSIDGKFKEGDVVRLVYSTKEEFSRGLTNYSSEDLNKIKGKQSKDIKAILGNQFYDEVIHRDNLVLLKS